MNNLRVVYFGYFNALSTNFLSNLIQAHVDLAGVVLPGYGSFTSPKTDLPVASKESEPITGLVQNAGIPLYYVPAGAWSDNTLAFIKRCQPDVILSVCFPYFIPERVRNIARRDSLNFHSSLLPAYRGPAPVFWQLYYGERNTGFSIHRLSDAIDAGEIYCQKTIQWPFGASGDDIDQLTASAGAQQFCALLTAFKNNTTTCRAQEESAMTYYPNPCTNDYIVPAEWTARRVFNFIRGVDEHGSPVVIRTLYEDIEIQHALAFSEDKITTPLQPGESDIPFTPGVLRVRTW